jgi:chromosomal replication initiation ATPase DnaA
MRKMTWQENRKKEIGKLLELIAQKFSVKKEQMTSKSRKKELVSARRLFMNILFEVFEKDKMTHSEISEIIKRDRTSFIHHRKEHLNEYHRYKNYRLDYDSFKQTYQSIIK